MEDERGKKEEGRGKREDDWIHTIGCGTWP
jgi:sarcosine oxidase delta subunit